jgi:hypothetical protein
MTASMNSFFAAGLFDSQWVVVVIIVAGALINWLSKRREAQADKLSEGEEPPPSPGKPAGEFNLEDALRRLMGEEPPAQSPAPPPIPPAPRHEPPPVAAWHEEGSFQRGAPTAPPMRLPPIAAARAGVTAVTVGEQQRQAARRFEQLNEQGRHPATVVGHGRRYRSRAGRRIASVWRDPRSARRAFVASLVFAPPKGLEG